MVMLTRKGSVDCIRLVAFGVMVLLCFFLPSDSAAHGHHRTVQLSFQAKIFAHVFRVNLSSDRKLNDD